MELDSYDELLYGGEQAMKLRKFWKPSVTTQFMVCPIPYHMDTYRGCTYGCLFCFARDFIQFTRRKTDHPVQSYIEGNDPKAFARWVERTMAKTENDYSHAEEVAFRERIPIKIGATADPFPLCENEERITHDVLKVLDGIDYPVQISTKNPEVFLEYADEFVNSNIALSVSCSFCDDDIARQIECGTIPVTRRMGAVRKLADMGYKVIARLHPFILPYALDNAERYVQMFKEAGFYGFVAEGLKLRVVMPQSEKDVYAKIGEVFGFDILKDFKENGVIEGSDREYSNERKNEVLLKYTELANQYGLVFLNGDNTVSASYGHGCECCGTGILRNHRIWGGCTRAKCFSLGENTQHSTEFGKCIVNFTRGKGNAGKTIQQVCDGKKAKVNFGGDKQLSLF